MFWRPPSVSAGNPSRPNATPALLLYGGEKVTILFWHPGKKTKNKNKRHLLPSGCVRRMEKRSPPPLVFPSISVSCYRFLFPTLLFFSVFSILFTTGLLPKVYVDPPTLLVKHNRSLSVLFIKKGNQTELCLSSICNANIIIIWLKYLCPTPWH